MIPAVPFGRETIETIIPHREPFILIDRVLEKRDQVPGAGAAK